MDRNNRGRAPSRAFREGALLNRRRGLVCVERTLLSAAFDSCPEKTEQSKSNRTGPQPDAKSTESSPPSGDANKPALRFAIGRANAYFLGEAGRVRVNEWEVLKMKIRPLRRRKSEICSGVGSAKRKAGLLTSSIHPKLSVWSRSLT